MEKKVKERTDIISPDMVFIRRWGIRKIFFPQPGNIPNTICLTFTEDEKLYYIINSIHPKIIDKFKIGERNQFKLRLFCDEKILVFWSSIQNRALKKLLKIRNIIKSNPQEYNRIIPDIDEYSIFFTEIDNTGTEWIVKCSFNEIEEILMEEITVVDNFKLSWLHVVSPLVKKAYITKTIETEIQCYIKESQRMWKNKIGNMDIAQYHLLMYEE